MAGKCTKSPQPELTRDHPPPPKTRPQQGLGGNCAQRPQPGLARDHEPTAAADPSQKWRETAPRTLRQLGRDHPPPPPKDPSQDWRGTAPRALSQHWRRTTHQHQQQTPARNGGELRPGPSTTIGEGPPTNTSSRPQPETGGNCAQGPPPGLERDHRPPPHAGPSQEWRGTAPRSLRHDRRGTTHQHQQQTPARNGRKLRPGRSAGIGGGHPRATNSGVQPRMAGSCAQAPQPGLVRDHPTPQTTGPSQEWRGTAARALSQEWRRSTHQLQQQTAAKNGRELQPEPSARIEEEPPTTTSNRPQP